MGNKASADPIAVSAAATHGDGGILLLVLFAPKSNETKPHSESPSLLLTKTQSFKSSRGFSSPVCNDTWVIMCHVFSMSAAWLSVRSGSRLSDCQSPALKYLWWMGCLDIRDGHSDGPQEDPWQVLWSQCIELIQQCEKNCDKRTENGQYTLPILSFLCVKAVFFFCKGIISPIHHQSDDRTGLLSRTAKDLDICLELVELYTWIGWILGWRGNSQKVEPGLDFKVCLYLARNTKKHKQNKMRRNKGDSKL